MKISLICPPINRFQSTPAPPLGLAYLAAALKNQGWDVSIIDLPILNNSFKALATHIREYQPNIVGITCTQSNSHAALRIASLVKALAPSVTIVLGGPYATFVAPKLLQKCPFVDAVAKGEGEETFVELVRRIAEQKSLDSLPGIVYRGNGRVIETSDKPLIEDLDSLPYPARHLLRMDLYRKLTRTTTIITSRGCPYRCPYCSSSAFWQHRIRFHSSERVLDEINLVTNTYSFRHFYFVDDTFTVDLERTTMLLEQLIKRKMQISWDCNTRVDCLSSDLLRTMRAAGCAKIAFGIESASERIRDSLGKSQINSEHIVSICKEAKNLGIKIKINFIVGLPGETEEDIWEDFRLLKQISPESTVCNFLKHYPGTELASQTSRSNDIRWKTEKLDELKRKKIFALLKKYQQETGIWMELHGTY